MMNSYLLVLFAQYGTEQGRCYDLCDLTLARFVAISKLQSLVVFVEYKKYQKIQKVKKKEVICNIYYNFE